MNSFIHGRAKLSVCMGGLLVPFNRAFSNIARYCRPLAFHNDDEHYDLSMAGSAFLVRVLGKNYLFATQHQRGDVGGERGASQIVILVAEGDHHVGIAPNELISVWRSSSSGRTCDDLMVLRYDDTREGRDLKPHFFPLPFAALLEAGELPSGCEVIAHGLIGFPSRFTEYDVSWDDDADAPGPTSVKSKWSRYYLAPAARTAWDEDDLTPYILEPSSHPGDIEPDGLSGSPVLMIYRDAGGQTQFAFTGIALKASATGRFNIFGAARIRALFDHGLGEEP